MLWTAGVHGPAMLAAIVTPVYLTMQMQNTHAFIAHAPLPYIVVVSLFLFVFPGGAGATLPLAALLAISHVPRLRRVGRATLLPALFNLNEPLLFAAPVVFNPHLILPFVGAPLVLATVTYAAVATGLVVARGLLHAVVGADVRLDVRRDAGFARDCTGRVQHRSGDVDLVSVRARLRAPLVERDMIAELCERFGIGGRFATRRSLPTSASAHSTTRATARARQRARRRSSTKESRRAISPGRPATATTIAARARYESLLARVLGAERALARLSIVSGTHAIVAAIAACTPAGQNAAFDLRPAVRHAAQRDLRRAACAGAARHRLSRDRARRRRRASILRALEEALAERPDATIFIQRSRGYAPRRSLSVAQCERAIAAVKRVAPKAAVLVDNCYGELVEEREPTHAGADLVMGSLIKNLGGSFALAGAYVAGRRRARRTRRGAPLRAGLRRRSRADARFRPRALPRALHRAARSSSSRCAVSILPPHSSRRSAIAVDPKPGERRTDIVQAIRLGSPELLRALCRRAAGGDADQRALSARAGSGARVREPVIMSSGAFVSGATIELSCDAPMRPPFEVYLQGGVSLAHAYLGALFAARECDAAS